MFGTGPPLSRFSVAHVLVEERHDRLERGPLDIVGLVTLAPPARPPPIGVLRGAEARPVGVPPRAPDQLVKLSEQSLEVVLVPADHEDRQVWRYPFDAAHP